MSELVKKREIRREYFRYLFPTIIAQVAHSFYCLADVFFVGAGVGPDGLAALNVALPIFTFYTTFSILIGVGAATTISVCQGQGDGESVDRVFTQAIAAVLAIGLLISVVGSLYLRQIAYLFGATDKIVGYVTAYLRPINSLAFIYMLSSSLTVIVRSDGNPKLVMLACTSGNVANILLDYLFVMKLGMGIFGAGLATILGPVITVSLLSLHFFLRQNHVKFVKKFLSWHLLVRTVKNGIGSSVLELSAGFVILAFNVVLIRVSGENAVAIFSIISNIAYVGKGVFNGMAQAAQPIISRSYGAGDYGVVRICNRFAMLTALLFSLAVYGVVLLFPGQLVAFFVSTEEAMVSMGASACILYFLSFPFVGLNTLLMYYFQSVEHAGSTLLIALCRGVVLTGLFLLLFAVLWGLTGVWLSLLAAEGLTFLIFYPVKLRQDRQFRTLEVLSVTPDPVP